MKIVNITLINYRNGQTFFGGKSAAVAKIDSWTQKMTHDNCEPIEFWIHFDNGQYINQSFMMRRDRQGETFERLVDRKTDVLIQNNLIGKI